MEKLSQKVYIYIYMYRAVGQHKESEKYEE